MPSSHRWRPHARTFPHPAEQPNRLVTEAESVARILSEMDVTVAIRMGNLGDDLFFDIGADTPLGATCLMKLARNRFINDHQFHEDMIDEAASTGYLLTDKPGLVSRLKNASGSEVGSALMAAGLMVDVDPNGVMPNFSPLVPGEITDSAHLIMNLIASRCAEEASFHREVRNWAFAIKASSVPTERA